MSRPRIRTLKPEFFKSRKVLRLGVGARYVAIGLISMVDDRGRTQRLIPALRSYVFPAGEVSERQVEKALVEIETVRFAWRYEADGFSYLWLPGFWEHQWLNRPSESNLPPHPDDPYGGLPIRNAIERYKEDHKDDRDNAQSNHRVCSPPAPAGAGARSVPVVDVVVDVQQTERLCDRLAARIRANDPKAAPRPGSERWRTDMRLLVEDRSGDIAEVERIIDWCQSDEFWRSNILSPGKLRKQFTALLLKSQGGQVLSFGRRESPSDLLRAINGGEAS